MITIFLFIEFISIYSVISVGMNDFPSYCKPGQHIFGKWILDSSNDTMKSFTCCGFDSNDYNDPEIKENCSSIGLGTKFNGPSEKMVLVGGYACSCDETLHQRRIKSLREKYIWIPDQCILKPWNSIDFCNVLRERNVLLIGDSTMQQTVGTFISMINRYKYNNQSFQSCSSQINFIRKDAYDQDYNHELYLWNEIINEYKYPDIIIINFAAHYPHINHFKRNHSSFERSIDHLINLLKYTQHSLYKEKDVIIVWKTANPGHINCFNHLEPSDKLIPGTISYDAVLSNHYMNNNNNMNEPINIDAYHDLSIQTSDRFGWRFFYEYDQLVYQKFISEFNITSYHPSHSHNHNHDHTVMKSQESNTRIDVSASHVRVYILDMFPLYYRPDSHPGRNSWQQVDCLHYCLPGALNIFSTLLLNLLSYDNTIVS